MSAHDRAAWEERWTAALRTHGERVASRPPNALLTEVAAGLPAGRALDAGCGHGAETLWLAGHGWQVTAVDFAATALAHARGTGEALGADVAARVTWVEADLGTWTPPPAAFGLVVSLYVHVAGSVEDFVGRMAGGVAPCGTLLLAGTVAPGQVQVSVEQALPALGDGWEVVVAEERPRPWAPSGMDAVVRAVRGAGPAPR